MALTADFPDTERGFVLGEYPFLIEAGDEIFKNAMVVVDADGYLKPAANVAGYVCVGRASDYVLNSGADGAAEVRVQYGVFCWDNSGTNACDQNDVGRPVYVEDDHTVADVGDVVAGIMLPLRTDSPGKVWVCTLPVAAPAPSLAAASSIETVTTGAISVVTRTTLLDIDGTKSFTLANGTYEGQLKFIRVIAATNTPDGTLTPATFADGTSIDVDAVNEQMILEYHASGGWRVISISGATITA